MNRKSLALLIIMLVVSLFFYHTNKQKKSPKPPLDDLVVKLDFSLKQNQLKEAIDTIKVIQHFYPKLPDVERFHYLLAQLYLARNDYDNATSSIDKLLNKKQLPEYLLLKGRIYQQQDFYDKALGIYQKMPQYIPAVLAIADIFIAQYKLTEAEQLLQKIPSEEKHKYRDLVFMGGKIQMLRGNYSQANELFSSFINNEKTVLSAHLFYIRTLSLQGQLLEAKSHYLEKAQNRKKAHYSFYRSLYASTLSPVEAIKEYQNIPQKSAIDHYHLLRNMLSLAQYDSAISLAKNSLRQIHNKKARAKIQELIVKAYLMTNKFAQAEKETQLLQSTKLYEKNLIECALAQQKFSLAQDIYAKISTNDKKEQLRNQILRNQISYYLQNYDRVIKETQSILTNTTVGMSEYPILLQDIARAFMAQKKYKDAATYFAKIYGEKTSLPDLLLSSRIWHGVAVYLDGDSEEAHKIWKSTSDISWKNYVIDLRMLQLISLAISGKQIENKLEADFDNHIALFHALYYLKTDSEKAKQMLEQVPNTQEFPSPIIQNILQNKF